MKGSPSTTGKPLILSRQLRYRHSMCRNIRPLFNFAPPATPEEIQAAAIQYVRKVSGTRKPTLANSDAFERAVEQVAAATAQLIDQLVTEAPPKTREEEARKGKERWEKRAARMKG